MKRRHGKCFGVRSDRSRRGSYEWSVTKAIELSIRPMGPQRGSGKGVVPEVALSSVAIVAYVEAEPPWHPLALVAWAGDG